jgi:hypothetical protein
MERTGLAMVGATCGLLVAVHVGSNIAMLTSQGFILLMMVVGAGAFYLGIDTPPLPFHEIPPGLPRTAEKVDVAEFLSAAGTFLAALAAIASMIAIAFREDPHRSATWLIMAGWVIGVTMQIVAGAIARVRA